MAPGWTRLIHCLACAFVVAFADLGPAAGSPGQSADILFPFASADLVRISPDGQWIAARGAHGEGQGVLVQRVGLGKIAVVGRYGDVRRMQWDGPSTLMIQTGDRFGRARVQMIELMVEKEAIRFQAEWLPHWGWLVDATPLEPGSVIWELEYGGRNSVHRIPLEDLLDWRSALSPRGFNGRTGLRIATIRGSALSWILDRAGRPVAALRRDENGFSILARLPGEKEFEVVHQSSDDEPRKAITPVGLTPDGATLLVLAAAGGEFTGLHEFDIGAKQLGQPVFQREDADVTGLLLDDLTHEPVLAWYTVAGETKSHYFDAYRDRLLAKLDDGWDKKSTSVVSTSADRNSFLFFVSSATNPGEFFFRDPNGNIVSVAQIGPEIDRASLSPVESLRVKSKDGLEVEAFLSLPRRAAGRAPLVVMPHGGPIGVHDVREYDPVVQYLVSWGFSVLQVNYRGSSGYGISFQERGKKQWAKGIEDDIDAAVEAAMRRPEIDSARICIIGGSYGGFSALVSVARHPKRYRCAVTINGVTDIPLMADSSDWADSEAAMKYYEESIGDLETERDKLLAVSPAYRVADIRVPVLIVHGLLDRRVDPDHAYRLISLLELHGRQHEVEFVDGAEHSLTRPQAIQVFRKVRRFLTAQLQPEIRFLRDPESPREVRQEVVPGEGIKQ